MTTNSAQSMCNSAPLVIVGTGAIALLSASQCALKGQPCYVQGRMTSDGGADSIDFRRGQQNFPLLISTRPAEFTHTTTMLVAVKAYDSVAACQQWLPLLASDGDLIVCHNGMGTIEPIASLLSPRQKLWFASTTHGALKHGAHQLVHTGMGVTRWGPANAAALESNNHTSVGTYINHALGPAHYCADIYAVLWQKLLINAVINPLTALHECRNGDLQQPQFAQTIASLVAEVVQIAAAAGQPLPNALDAVYKVITATAENYSSMQQDVVKHRRTELAAITGFLLQSAARHRLAVPFQQQLWQQLTARLEPWQYQ